MRAAPLGVWGARFDGDPEELARCAVADSSLSHPNPSCGHAVAEVQRWLAEAEAMEPVEFTVQIGFVKIAFVNAFQHLLKGSSYEAALEETLLGGGDTDTNAAIVGGLVGAAEGDHGVPESMRTALSSCDTKLGRSRPDFLHPRRVPELVSKLLG